MTHDTLVLLTGVVFVAVAPATAVALPTDGERRVVGADSTDGLDTTSALEDTNTLAVVDGTYGFGFGFTTANTADKASVTVGGSTGTVVELEEEIEAEVDDEDIFNKDDKSDRDAEPIAAAPVQESRSISSSPSTYASPLRSA